MRAFKCDCGKMFNWSAEKAGKRATCPGCKQPITIPQMEGTFENTPQPAEETNTPHCPNCKTALQANAVICLECGYDIRTGKQLKTKVTVSKKVDTSQSEEESPTPGQQSNSYRADDSDDIFNNFPDEHPLIAGKLKDLTRSCPLFLIMGLALFLFKMAYFGSVLVFAITPICVIALVVWSLIAKAKGAKEEVVWAIASAIGSVVLLVIAVLFGLRPDPTLFTADTMKVAIIFGPIIAGLILLVLYGFYPQLAASYVEDRTRPTKCLIAAFACLLLGVLAVVFAGQIAQLFPKNKHISRSPVELIINDIPAVRECVEQVNESFKPTTEITNGREYALTTTTASSMRSYDGGAFADFERTYGPAERRELASSSQKSNGIVRVYWYGDIAICTDNSENIIYVMCERTE